MIRLKIFTNLILKLSIQRDFSRRQSCQVSLHFRHFRFLKWNSSATYSISDFVRPIRDRIYQSFSIPERENGKKKWMLRYLATQVQIGKTPKFWVCEAWRQILKNKNKKSVVIRSVWEIVPERRIPKQLALKIEKKKSYFYLTFVAKGEILFFSSAPLKVKKVYCCILETRAN